MSLNRKRELAGIAKVVCRELRKKSTQAEIILWSVIRNRKLEGRKFLRQHPLFFDMTGKVSFFVADFYCHEEKLIIELDGKYHKYRLKEDEERSRILDFLGLSVIRFKNEKIINNLDKVINEIKNIFNK
jgi:very-short-patch-repair endonuclease